MGEAMSTLKRSRDEGEEEEEDDDDKERPNAVQCPSCGTDRTKRGKPLTKRGLAIHRRTCRGGGEEEEEEDMDTEGDEAAAEALIRQRKDAGAALVAAKKYRDAVDAYAAAAALLDARFGCGPPQGAAFRLLYTQVHSNLAHCHLALSSASSALQHAELALKSDASSVKAGYRKGCSLLMLGDPMGALNALRTVGLSKDAALRQKAREAKTVLADKYLRSAHEDMRGGDRWFVRNTQLIRLGLYDPSTWQMYGWEDCEYYQAFRAFVVVLNTLPSIVDVDSEAMVTLFSVDLADAAAAARRHCPPNLVPRGEFDALWRAVLKSDHLYTFSDRYCLRWTDETSADGVFEVPAHKSDPGMWPFRVNGPMEIFDKTVERLVGMCESDEHDDVFSAVSADAVLRDLPQALRQRMSQESMRDFLVVLRKGIYAALAEFILDVPFVRDAVAQHAPIQAARRATQDMVDAEEQLDRVQSPHTGVSGPILTVRKDVRLRHPEDPSTSVTVPAGLTGHHLASSPLPGRTIEVYFEEPLLPSAREGLEGLFDKDGFWGVDRSDIDSPVRTAVCCFCVDELELRGPEWMCCAGCGRERRYAPIQPCAHCNYHQ